MRLSAIVFVFAFFALAHAATAQNFQPFRNTFSYEFLYRRALGFDTTAHVITVDSAAVVNSDSIFYFNKLNTTKDNFWGCSMVKKNSGIFLFLVTRDGYYDTVVVKTQQPLWTKWKFTLNNVVYTATYANYKQETVLTNQTDYVKTIIVEDYNGFKDSIKVSENFGFVYSFPFFDDSFYKHNNFSLNYIFNTHIGDNKLDFFEYFDYDAGDMLIYSPHSPGPPTDRLDYDIYKVLTKTVSADGDTIRYQLSKCHVNAIDNGVYSMTQTHCTLTVTAFSVTGDFPYIGLLSLPTNKNTTMLFAYEAYRGGLYIVPDVVFEGFPSYTFTRGLGLSQYYYNGAPNYDDRFYRNIEYIKQSNTDDDCSSIQTILAVKSSQAISENLMVAPNPFENSISLNTSNLLPGNSHLRIVSSLGVEVYTSEAAVSSSNQQLDLSGLSSLSTGVYFLFVENEGRLYSQKIIKK